MTSPTPTIQAIRPDKTLDDLTPQDREALLTVLEWHGKPLKDCSRKDLLACVVWMTAQVVILKDKLTSAGIPVEGENHVTVAQEPAQP